jgi:hypothetical protein
MTRTLTHHRTTLLLAAALSIGIAAPAGAMPLRSDPHLGLPVPVETTPPAVQSVATSDGGGGISDLGYVAIGTGGLAVALIGAGGVRTATRRRRHTADPRVAPGALTDR